MSYFLYEGETLRAADKKLHEVMKYYKVGRVVLQGTPENHKTDVTKVAFKLLAPHKQLLSLLASVDDIINLIPFSCTSENITEVTKHLNIVHGFIDQELSRYGF